jgi:hypothetical protein
MEWNEVLFLQTPCFIPGSCLGNLCVSLYKCSSTLSLFCGCHREALAAQELKRTLHGFFNQKMDKKDMSVAETASWRTAPFSAAYYKRVNQSLRKKGRKTFSQQPSRLKQPARRRLHYKWKRTMAGNKTLWECGFVRKETPIDRRSHAPMGEKEFSGTRVSTAP